MVTTAQKSLYSKIFKKDPAAPITSKLGASQSKSSAPVDQRQSIAIQNAIPTKSNPITKAVSSSRSRGTSSGGGGGFATPATSKQIEDANKGNVQVTELGNVPLISQKEAVRMQSSTNPATKQFLNTAVVVPEDATVNESMALGTLTSGQGFGAGLTRTPLQYGDKRNPTGTLPITEERRLGQAVNDINTEFNKFRNVMQIQKIVETNPELLVGQTGVTKTQLGYSGINDKGQGVEIIETTYSVSPEYYKSILSEKSPVYIPNASTFGAATNWEYTLGVTKGTYAIAYGAAELPLQFSTRQGTTVGELRGWVSLPKSDYVAKINRVPFSTAGNIGTGVPIVAVGLPAVGNVLGGFKVGGFEGGLRNIAQTFSPISISPKTYAYDTTKFGTYKETSVVSKYQSGEGYRIKNAVSVDKGFNNMGLTSPTTRSAQIFSRNGGREYGFFSKTETVPTITIEGGTKFGKVNIGRLTTETQGGYVSSIGKGKYVFGNKRFGSIELQGGESASVGQIKSQILNTKEYIITDTYFPNVESRLSFSGGLARPTSNPNVVEYVSGGLKGFGQKSSSRYTKEITGTETTFNLEGTMPKSDERFITNIQDSPFVSSTQTNKPSIFSRISSEWKIGLGKRGQSLIQVEVPETTTTTSERFFSPSISTPSQTFQTTTESISTGVFAVGGVKNYLTPQITIQTEDYRTSVTSGRSSFSTMTTTVSPPIVNPRIKDFPTVVNIPRTYSDSGSSTRQITIPTVAQAFEMPVPFSPPTTTPNAGFNFPTSTPFFLPPIKLGLNVDEGLGTRRISGKKRRSKYTPSFEALVLNIRGKQPKGIETGLRIRPIPKGFKWSFGRIKL